MQNNFLLENTIFIETIMAFISKLKFWNFTGMTTYSFIVPEFLLSISSYPIQPLTTILKTDPATKVSWKLTQQ